MYKYFKCIRIVANVRKSLIILLKE